MTIIAYVFLSVESWDLAKIEKWQKSTNNIFVIICMALFIKRHVFKFFTYNKNKNQGLLNSKNINRQSKGDRSQAR